MSNPKLKELAELLQDLLETNLENGDSPPVIVKESSLDEVGGTFVSDMALKLETHRQFFTDAVQSIASVENLSNAGCLGEAVYNQCDKPEINPERVIPDNVITSIIASIMGNLQNVYVMGKYTETEITEEFEIAVNAMQRSSHYFIGVLNHPKYVTAEEQFDNLRTDPEYIEHLKDILAYVPQTIDRMLEGLKGTSTDGMVTRVQTISMASEEEEVNEDDIYRKPEGTVIH